MLVLLALTSATASPALAQTGVIQGQVVDAASRRPLSNAQMLVVGTGAGQLTNSSGRYVLLNVPAGEHDVRVTLIGYTEAERTVTVTAGQTATADIEMSSTAISLNEIVVTGLGVETERRALGTSVEVLSAEDFELAPVQSIDQLLQGRVAGATVSATSAQPGTGSLINFRGVSSVFSAQTPVIYIDGVRVDNDHATTYGTGGEQSSALSDLLTSDIERIEVTKGGAASTLFGSDAATGVIQIFTKKGAPGAPRITARVERGIEQPELWNILDTRLIFPERVESGEVTGTFMEDLYFKQGTIQSYYMGVTGGTADVTYSVSGRLEDRTGTQPKDGSTNYNLRGGLQASLSEDFTLEFSASYVRHNFDRLYNGAAIADPLTTFEVGDALFFSGAGSLQEALDIFLLPDITEWVNRFIFSSGARWNVRDDLTVRFNVGADNRTNQQRAFDPIGFTPATPNGRLNRRDRSFTSVSLDGGATYSWESPARTLGSQLTVGVQGFREEESIVNGFGLGFALPGTTYFDAAAIITAYEGNVEVFNGGLYVDEQVSVWNKLYVGGGFRLDAGSIFGDNIDTEFYPKATGSYIVSEDLDLPLVDELKIRAAFGQTGKFPGAFLKDRTYSATSFRGESAPRFANPGESGFEAGEDIHDRGWNRRGALVGSSRLQRDGVRSAYDGRALPGATPARDRPGNPAGKRGRNPEPGRGNGAERAVAQQPAPGLVGRWIVPVQQQPDRGHGRSPGLFGRRLAETCYGLLDGDRRGQHRHLPGWTRWRLVGDDANGHQRGRTSGWLGAPVHGWVPGSGQERWRQHDDFCREQPCHQRAGRLGRGSRGIRLGVGVGHIQRRLPPRTPPLRVGGGGGARVRPRLPHTLQP